MDITKKIGALKTRTRQPTINYRTLDAELAGDLSGNQPDHGHDTGSWIVPQAARPDHKRPLPSVRKSKMFKLSLNKSLAILERRGLRRIYVPPREMRGCPGEKHPATASKGRE